MSIPQIVSFYYSEFVEDNVKIVEEILSKNTHNSFDIEQLGSEIFERLNKLLISNKPENEEFTERVFGTVCGRCLTHIISLVLSKTTKNKKQSNLLNEIRYFYIYNILKKGRSLDEKRNTVNHGRKKKRTKMHRNLKKLRKKKVRSKKGGE